jgi:hypothetical protein
MLLHYQDLWRCPLAVATVIKIRQQQQNQDGVTDVVSTGCNYPIPFFIIMELNLDECWKMKPLMDGRQGGQALDLPRGPQVGTYLDEQVMDANAPCWVTEGGHRALAVGQAKRRKRVIRWMQSAWASRTARAAREPSAPLTVTGAEQHFRKSCTFEVPDV